MELPTPQAVHTALEMKTGHDRFAKAHEAAYLIAWAYADGLLEVAGSLDAEPAEGVDEAGGTG